jgi:hypothetical protein
LCLVSLLMSPFPCLFHHVECGQNLYRYWKSNPPLPHCWVYGISSPSFSSGPPHWLKECSCSAHRPMVVGLPLCGHGRCDWGPILLDSHRCHVCWVGSWQRCVPMYYWNGQLLVAFLPAYKGMTCTYALFPHTHSM